jgi:hypothetical protein
LLSEFLFRKEKKKMRAKMLLSTGVIIFLLISWSYVLAATKIPLPENFNVVAPDPSLPEEIRALSGRWEGKWNWPGGGQDAILIVEKIDPGKAQGIYAWGDFGGFVRGGGHVSPGYRRVTLKVTSEDGRVTLSGETIRFSLTKDRLSILDGWDTRRPGYGITMKKVE